VTDVEAAVATFHRFLGQPGPDRPSLEQHAARRDLRIALLEGETAELVAAIRAGDLTAIAHELADLAIAVYGTAHTYGLPLNEVVAVVHRSNMTRTPTASGKAVKGVGYVYPDVGKVLDAAAARPDQRPAFRFPTGRPEWLGTFQEWPCGSCGKEADDSTKHFCRPTTTRL
jgi:NTP pyrophosphatase (non-canonical NTP hydrolase)